MNPQGQCKIDGSEQTNHHGCQCLTDKYVITSKSSRLYCASRRVPLRVSRGTNQMRGTVSTPLVKPHRASKFPTASQSPSLESLAQSTFCCFSDEFSRGIQHARPGSYGYLTYKHVSTSTAKSPAQISSSTPGDYICGKGIPNCGVHVGSRFALPSHETVTGPFRPVYTACISNSAYTTTQPTPRHRLQQTGAMP